MSRSENPYGDRDDHWTRRRRGPRPLTAALESLRSGALPPTLLARVQEQWPQAAGTQIAAEATPVAESNGRVTISCSSSVWASELTMMSAALLDRLNGCLSDGPQVAALSFVTGPRPGAA